METYSNTGHVDVFKVGLKWVLHAGAQLIANTSKLHVAGIEILFIYCFTLAFNKFSYLCLGLQYCLSLAKPFLRKISKSD